MEKMGADLEMKAQILSIGPAEEYVDNPENFFKNEEGQVLQCKVRINMSFSGIMAKNVSL